MEFWWLHQYYENDGFVSYVINKDAPKGKEYMLSENVYFYEGLCFDYWGDGFDNPIDALTYQRRLMDKNTKMRYVMSKNEYGSKITFTMDRETMFDRLVGALERDGVSDEFEQLMGAFILLDGIENGRKACINHVRFSKI